jgi:MFS superfamily sulfate permease-like transporter
MITVIYVGKHEVRLAEPGLVSLRLQGELTRPEASEVLHILREHLTKRDGRVLIDVSKLGNVPHDCRHELEALCKELDAGPGPARLLAFVGAHMLHKAILAPLLTRANNNSGVRLEARFFPNQDDALSWLRAAVAELFASSDSIYVTRLY